MFRYFAVEKDPGMLIFLTDADMSLNSERERLEDKLTQRTGVKCVVVDCVEEARRNSANEHKFYLKMMLSIILSCFFGGLFAVLLMF